VALTRQRRFVAEAAHELRTPLTLLHTRVQLFERAARRRGDDALAVEARAILDDSRRLGEVIEDLLLAADLARNADRRTVVDLSRLTRDVVAAAAAQAEQQAVRLTFRDDPTPVRDASVQNGSPGIAPSSATVLGIESALRRAVTALIDNALGHTPSGGTVTVTVSHRTDRGTKMLTVRVSDTGIGLDPTHARRLFERFARGETTGDRRRFGLGLALVHETIANHQGRIEVDGALGRGASFTILLPANPAPETRPVRTRPNRTDQHRCADDVDRVSRRRQP
jgi:signal transduction histidine kinase